MYWAADMEQASQGKLQHFDDGNIVRAMKENLKTTFSDVTNNLHRAGEKF